MRKAVQDRDQCLQKWQAYSDSLKQERDHLQREVAHLNQIVSEISAEKERLILGHVDPILKDTIKAVQRLRHGRLSGRELQVWRVVSASEKPLFLREIIDVTKLPHSTVEHCLTGLKHKGYLTSRKTGQKHYFYSSATKIPPKAPPSQNATESRMNIGVASVGVPATQSVHQEGAG